MDVNSSPRFTTPFVVIAALFVCLLMMANIVAGRLIEIRGLVIWLGIGANILMALYFYFLIRLPYPADFVSNDAFSTVLGATPLIVFASILAFFLGEFTNSATLSILKKS